MPDEQQRKENSIGKVWLVGAGPGEEGLLTIKGREVLEEAETVVYDALVGKAILSMIPEKAEVLYVGKRAGNHAMVQEEINAQLLKMAREGKRVVRLHGGDPFLFGRGAEELELLEENQVPFEVVPGVPSAIAVPSYCGIPVTHRDFCSSLHIITGHQKKGEPLHIDFQALTQMGGTLVFLMGLSSLPVICSGLLAAGMSEQMPAAVLSQGTGAGQHSVVATLSTLVQETQKQQVLTPAIIVVGEVCKLSKQFNWYEKMPLFGTRLILTRPRERSRTLAQKLRRLGAEVWEVPTISTVPRRKETALDEALEKLSGEGRKWLVFTSPAGVRIFWQKLSEKKRDVRSLGRVKIAVLGAGTCRELEEHGIYADLMPEKYDGQALGRLLGEQVMDGDYLAIPRASQGNPELIREIVARKKVQIDDIPLYDTVYEKLPWINPGDILGEDTRASLYAVFTSSSTVKGFAELAGKIDFTRVRAVCIGRQTQEAALALGMEAVMSNEATVDSLVEKIIELRR